MEFDNAVKCSCGAITVTIGNQSYSMNEGKFKELFGKLKLTVSFYNCNHCVNHWGIDLCACGSGEFIEICEEGHSCCGQPMQTIGEVQEVSLWRG